MGTYVIEGFKASILRIEDLSLIMCSYGGREAKCLDNCMVQEIKAEASCLRLHSV